MKARPLYTLSTRHGCIKNRIKNSNSNSINIHSLGKKEEEGESRYSDLMLMRSAFQFAFSKKGIPARKCIAVAEMQSPKKLLEKFGKGFLYRKRQFQCAERCDAVKADPNSAYSRSHTQKRSHRKTNASAGENHSP